MEKVFLLSEMRIPRLFDDDVCKKCPPSRQSPTVLRSYALDLQTLSIRIQMPAGIANETNLTSYSLAVANVPKGIADRPAAIFVVFSSAN